MVRWSGFADLVFSDSARLALARAVELTGTDVVDGYPGAWLVEDRRIAFSLEADTPAAVVDAVKRLLGELVAQAASGEAFVETAIPAERWVRKPNVPTISEQIQVASEDPESIPTIRSVAS